MYLGELGVFLLAGQFGVFPDRIQLVREFQFVDQILRVPISGQHGQNRPVGRQNKDLNIVRSRSVRGVDGTSGDRLNA